MLYLEKIKSQIKQKIQNTISSKSNINIFFDALVYIFFFATFFSIPTCSFHSSMTYVTWVLTITTFLLMIFSIFLFYEPKIDFISITLFLFGISSFISTLINGFQVHKITPILLVFSTLIIYSYSKANKQSIKILFLLTYLSIIAFLITFIIIYFDQIISFDFDRLGNKFGDENDISIFMGMGSAFSIYYFWTNKNVFLKIINVLMLALFFVCGTSCGSKIYVILFIVCTITVIFMFFGRKKWWLSLIIILIIFALGYLILCLPFFETIKTRFFDFISTFFGKTVSDGNTDDMSTINRFGMFLCGLEMFFRKPLFGFGIWGFATFGGINGGWSHNHISEILCNYGLIGTFLFEYGFVFAIYSYFKKKEKKEFNMSFLFMVFFIATMISVALDTQKIYAYFIGIPMAHLIDDNSPAVLNFKLIKKRKKMHGNC